VTLEQKAAWRSEPALVPQLPAAYARRQETRGMAQVVALVDDLFFQAKLLETAKQLGIELRTFASSEAFIAEIAKDAPKLVVVDLNARNHPLEAIERARATASDIPLIGFLSHVQVELAERARVAGCRSVMPRSKFTRDLATILAQAVSESS
jgi:DNA-binding NarL/FixJ family response regulator